MLKIQRRQRLPQASGDCAAMLQAVAAVACPAFRADKAALQRTEPGLCLVLYALAAAHAMLHLRRKAGDIEQLNCKRQHHEARIALTDNRQRLLQKLIQLRLRRPVLRQHSSQLCRHCRISHLLHVQRLRHLHQLAAAQLVHLLALLHLDAQISKGLQQPPLHIALIARAVGDKAQLAMLTRKADSVLIRRLPIAHMQHQRLVCQQPVLLTHRPRPSALQAPPPAASPARALRGSLQFLKS